MLLQCGNMPLMRERWMEVEDMDADVIYVCDHFKASILDPDVAAGKALSQSTSDKNFESTTVQAAIAATTSRIEIGCLVHAIGYRNPNLMADIARTIDHISGGRYILGMGASHRKGDYDEYGYEYGTQKSRALDLARDIPVIKARLEKLNPLPLRRIPLLIGSMGEHVGMRTVAEHADMWHLYGPVDTLRHKIEVMKRICDEVGRDFNELEIVTNYNPHLLGDKDTSPDIFLRLGIKHIVTTAQGPNWDLGVLRKLIEWRRNLS